MKWFGVGVDILGVGSHPARGAWIEMTVSDNHIVVHKVAPREGCVD